MPGEAQRSNAPRQINCGSLLRQVAKFPRDLPAVVSVPGLPDIAVTGAVKANGRVRLTTLPGDGTLLKRCQDLEAENARLREALDKIDRDSTFDLRGD